MLKSHNWHRIAIFKWKLADLYEFLCLLIVFFSLSIFTMFLVKSAVSFNWKRECNVKTPMEKIMKYVKHWHGFYYYLLLNFFNYLRHDLHHSFVHFGRSYVRSLVHSFVSDYLTLTSIDVAHALFNTTHFQRCANSVVWKSV